MNKLIKIIIFILISFSISTFVLEREFLTSELPIFIFFLKKSVAKKRRIATLKKTDFVPMMHRTNQRSVINEDFLIESFDFETRKILFKNKRTFSFTMIC